MPEPNITPTNSIPYIVPLKPQNQELDVSLGGVTYHLRVIWNSASNCWILNIENDQRVPLLSGIPMVTGCDLLEQYGYLHINGALIVQSSDVPGQVPDYASLGDTGTLFYVIPIAGNT